MKTIRVNQTDVTSKHVVKTDDTHHTSVHVTVTAGQGEDMVELTSVLTVGSVDEPLPTTYDKNQLQRDLDVFRDKLAAMAESKLRAKKIAAGLE
jgi:hypothetical protein